MTEQSCRILVIGSSGLVKKLTKHGFADIQDDPTAMWPTLALRGRFAVVIVRATSRMVKSGSISSLSRHCEEAGIPLIAIPVRSVRPGAMHTPHVLVSMDIQDVIAKLESLGIAPRQLAKKTPEGKEEGALSEQADQSVQLLFIGQGANALATQLQARGFTTSALTAAKWSENGFGGKAPQAVIVGTSPGMLTRIESAPSILESICRVCDIPNPPVPIFIIPHRAPMVMNAIQRLGIEIPPPGKSAHYTTRCNPREIEQQLFRELGIKPLNPRSGKQRG